MIVLPDKQWTDSLECLRDVYKSAYETQSPLQSAHRRYIEKLEQVGLVWRRLQDGVRNYFDYRDWFHDSTSVDATRRLGLKTSVEIEGRQKRMDRFVDEVSFLQLDIEDFYLHADILLDRVVCIVGLIIRGIPPEKKREDEKWKNFGAHRKFLLQNNPSLQLQEYAFYVREKTAWFEEFNEFRNLDIVHDIESSVSRIATGPEIIGIAKHRRQNGREVLRYTDNLSRLADNIIEYISFVGQHFCDVHKHKAL